MKKAEVPNVLKQMVFNKNLKGEGYTIPESANNIWRITAEKFVKKNIFTKKGNAYFMKNQKEVKKVIQDRKK